MRLIEKYGSGIGRIVAYFKQEGLPVPDFRNISEGFQVTVYGKEYSEKSIDNKPVIALNGTPVITDRERKILELIQNDNFIKREKIAELLNISINTVKTFILGLKKKGLLERIGNNKTGHWTINYKFMNVSEKL